MVGGSEGRADGITGAFLSLFGQEGIDGFFKAASEEIFVAGEGNGAGVFGGEFVGEVEAVDCLQKKDGPHAVVEVTGATAEGVELLALGKERCWIEPGTCFGQRAVAQGGIVRRDDGNEHGLPGHGDEFDDRGHDFVTTFACQSHAELGSEESVGFSDVKADAFDFASEVVFVLRRGVQAGAEKERSAIAFSEMFHYCRVDDMHTEETEIISRAQAGDDEFLFGNGGRGFFENGGDFVESIAATDTLSANGAVDREFAFVSRLDCRD